MTIICLIIIAFLIVIIILASQKIKRQEKRINLLEYGIEGLEKIDMAMAAKKTSQGK